jgi:Tat protein secretion system quality control protein TatD with DNase activity
LRRAFRAIVFLRRHSSTRCFGIRRSDDDWRVAEIVAAGAVAIGECGLDYHYDNSLDWSNGVLSPSSSHCA